MKKMTWACLMAALVSLSGAASITVDPSATRQKIVGFGGGVVYYQGWITALGSQTREALYDTAFTGLNLSLLRIGNWKQESSTSIADDAEIIKAAKKRLGTHMKIEMSSWSAPGNLKPSGSVNGNDAGLDTLKATLNKANDPYGQYAYSAFASWWKTSYLAYEDLGIAPDYISFQNEPDMFAKYEETLFAPSETSRKAGYAEALAAMRDTMNTLSNPPKIIGPEPLGIGYNNFQNYMAKLDDSKLDGYAYHLYHAGAGNDDAGKNYLSPENFRSPMKSIANKWGSDEKPIIMTEFCNMLGEEREVDMVGLAHIMQVGFTDGKLAGYIAWELFWGEGRGQLIGVCTKNWGTCSEDKFTISPEYHAMRHYSKFVNPGWRVVSSTSDNSGLYTVAFRSADCDSISVIAINTNSSAVSLSSPSVSGYTAIDAVQSVQNGEKSKKISTGASYTLPAASITTFVYKTENTSGLSCEDSPIETLPEVGGANDTIVIVDYTKGNSSAVWSGDFSATYYDSPFDGVSGYVAVPLAGCEQGSESCSYQHAILTPSDEVLAQEPFSRCEKLVITMRSQDDTTAYVNVGGIGDEWINYQYGRAALASKWDEAEVSLENEEKNNSSKLTFNSNASGIYISKIIATGCATSSIARARPVNAFNPSARATIFNLKGQAVWKGLYKEALLRGNELQISIPKGVYLLKTNGVSKTVFKR